MELKTKHPCIVLHEYLAHLGTFILGLHLS